MPTSPETSGLNGGGQRPHCERRARPDHPGRPGPDVAATSATGRRIADAAPLRHLSPVGPLYPGAAYDVVSGVACAALPLPWAWGAQACLTAVPDDDLVEVASEVTAWLAQHSHAGWQLEIDSERAPVLVDALDLSAVREHEVWRSVGEPPSFDVDLDVGPPVDEDEFLAVFGPALVPMIRGQLGRPDWEVGVLREAGEVVGCFRLMDLAETTYLGGVSIVPHRRGRGLGRALSGHATRRARRRSDLVWLQCEPELGPFYASLGYGLEGRSTYLSR